MVSRPQRASRQFPGTGQGSGSRRTPAGRCQAPTPPRLPAANARVTAEPPAAARRAPAPPRPAQPGTLSPKPAPHATKAPFPTHTYCVSLLFLKKKYVSRAIYTLKRLLKNLFEEAILKLKPVTFHRFSSLNHKNRKDHINLTSMCRSANFSTYCSSASPLSLQ